MAQLDSTFNTPNDRSNGGTARLGAGLHFKGEITGTEDLWIDGTVEGVVKLDEKKLTVGATAKVTAEIMAGEVIAYGSVKGNVCAKRRIEIKKDGSVVGDLTTVQIIIEDGAYFKGSIEIGEASGSEEKSVARKRSGSTVSTAASAV